jgi:uncharacterized protein YbdZ (MbtH family)
MALSLHSSNTEESSTYKVVVNAEEQYSIWPEGRANALGWHDAGKSGPKEECLAYIREVWTDMRPLSLRKKMEEAAQSATMPREQASASEIVPGEDDLLKRLSHPGQPVQVSLRPEKSAEAFHKRIQQGHVYLKFTGTQGGTELGIKLDQESVRMEKADFANRTGTVHLEGGLKVNYKNVRCIADIDLTTLSGHGHVQVIES